MSKPRPQIVDLPPPPPGLSPQAGAVPNANWQTPGPLTPNQPQAVQQGPFNAPPMVHPKAMDPLAKIGFFKALYHFMTDKSASMLGRFFVLFVAVYVISPVDALPEMVAGPFGLLDDLGLAGVAAMYLMWVLGPYRDGSRTLVANNPTPAPPPTQP
ncbi:MAG: YkvA family protein [Polyangiaceae bacterium]